MPMSTNLCHACHDLIEQIHPRPGTSAPQGVVHRISASFFSAVDAGCLLCAYLHARFFEDEDKDARDVAHAARMGAVATQSPFMVYSLYTPGDREQKERRGRWVGVYLRVPSLKWEYAEGKRERRLVWVPEGESVTDFLVATLYLEVCWPDPGRGDVLLENRGEVEDLEVRWPRVVSWLQECLDGHPECVGNSTRPWTPSRLLDLGESSASVMGDIQRESSPSIRLCLAEECVPSVPYMTLSHCWGIGPQPLRLLTTNLEDMRAGISLDRLPATFQQAVAVTRRLGVRYLWIDSLCIIQDSKSDWFHESARMCDVYRHSYCNIAATSARNGTQGCFLARTLRSRPPWTFALGAPPVLCEVYDYAAAGLDFRAAPLNTRAWVLQERLLAPRVVVLYGIWG